MKDKLLDLVDFLYSNEDLRGLRYSLTLNGEEFIKDYKNKTNIFNKELLKIKNLIKSNDVKNFNFTLIDNTFNINKSRAGNWYHLDFIFYGGVDSNEDDETIGNVIYNDINFASSYMQINYLYDVLRPRNMFEFTKDGFSNIKELGFFYRENSLEAQKLFKKIK